MEIRRINSIEEFDQLKTNWESVYAADPHAHIFVSWMWLRGWLAMAPYAWFVLALRPDKQSPYVAFFPLIMRGPRIYQFRPIRTLHMGGQPIATYTGFVCLPEYEEEALEAFAYHIQRQLGWDRFEMEAVLDPRLDAFLKCFPQEEFDIRRTYGMPGLYIPLPDTWDDYLQQFLGSGTRQSLKRRIRQVKRLDKFSTTQVQADNVEMNIELLLTLWQKRWGPKPTARWRRRMLHYFFDNNNLWLTALWSGTIPIAALVALLDRQKKTFTYYISGFNERFAKISPGRVMVAHSIRCAIEDGFQVYDFLTGTADYKLSFGPKRRNTTNVVIMRRGLKSTVANTLLDWTRRSGDLLVKLLGKIKRIGIVKQIWFWLLARVKR